MYFDLFSDYESEFEFKFENSQGNLPKVSKENDERPIKEHHWYLASTLLGRLKDTNDEDQVADEIIEDIDDKLKKKYVRRNIKAFYKNIITAETLGISKVFINKTFDETNMPDFVTQSRTCSSKPASICIGSVAGDH